MIKAVIFDCFGVVLDDGLAIMLDELDKTKPEAREFIVDAVHQNNRGLITPSEFKRQVADFLGTTPDKLGDRIERAEVRNNDVINLIKNLRQTYKTALLSNVGRGSLHRRFTEEELQELFDVVVASGEIGVMKPHPHIYELTADKLGVDPTECIFIDDRAGHVQGANEVGMNGILYESFAQTKKALYSLLPSS